MNFTDEESRLIFHQSKTLLQMVCQMFERFCHCYVANPEFVDLLDEEHAIMGVPEVSLEQAEELVLKINEQFPRVDNLTTCKIMDPDLNLFEIFVTKSEDFRNFN